MEFEHEFTVPLPPSRAWDVLTDVERVAPCMPGATLGSVEPDDAAFTGTVKVKVGPMTVTYSGRARFVERDQAAGRVVVEAKGRETRGAGTAGATVTASTGASDDDGTRVVVHTDLTVTGKPAQFGRGVMNDVGSKLIGQFANCLATELTAQAATGVGRGQEGEPVVAGPARPSADAIDLVQVGGAPIARRLVPAVAGLAVIIVIVWVIGWVIVRAL